MLDLLKIFVTFAFLIAQVASLPVSSSAFNENVPPALKDKCEEDGSCTVIGDMIIRRNTNNFSSLSAVVNRAWPAATIPYYIQSSVSSNSQKLNIVNAGIAELNQKTCLTVRPYKSGDRGYITITGAEDGCFSSLGYWGGEQKVNLGNGCYSVGTVVHEIMHAAGFYHEQSRNDRDSYVQINFQNIEAGRESQFLKTSELTNEEVSAYDVEYNYDSVMHYPPTAFASPKRAITIQSLDNPDALGRSSNMGQRQGLSQGDIDEIKGKYGQLSNKSNCKN